MKGVEITKYLDSQRPKATIPPSPTPSHALHSELIYSGSCGILTETKARGMNSDFMPEYMLVMTTSQKHGCPSERTPWALCTQPRLVVWGDFTPVLLIIHTSGYFHMHIGATDWSRFQCHLWALGVDLWVLKAHM